MKIKLMESKVKLIELSEDDSVEKDDFSFSLSNGFTEEDSVTFVVLFDLTVSSMQGFKLNVVYESVFETDEVIHDSFKESHFPIVNAPAIAYPFLRSFVSLITLNSGYEPLILPTINFQARYKKHKS